MRRIDPNTLYETEELLEIIRGFVSIEVLRKEGLCAFPGRGYWGGAVIAAIDRLCKNRPSQPRGVSRRKETNDAFFENGERDPGDRLVGSRTPKNEVESQRKRQPDRETIHGLGGSNRKVESQREKLRRLSQT